MKINRNQHDHVLEFVDDLLYDVLNKDDAQWVEDHCERCSVCRAAMQEARKRFEAVASVPVTEASEKLIVEALESSQVRADRWTGRWRIVNRTAAAVLAASVLLIGAAQLYYRQLAPTPYDLRILGHSQFLPGSSASVRVAVYDARAGRPIPDVETTLRLRDRDGGRTVRLAGFRTGADGVAMPRFLVPDWRDGEYQIVLSARGDGFDESVVGRVRLRRSWKVMLSTDKPVYQPGQTIRVRAISLRRPDLKPVAGEPCEFTITDPKGNVVFRRSDPTSRFGIASCDCPLAAEILEGSYQVRCRVGDTESESTVEIQRYVLPKFTVRLSPDRPYYQPGDTLTGNLKAEYFFGKPVTGARVQLELRGIDAESFRIDLAEGVTDEQGDYAFRFSIPGSLAGRPQDGGDARVELLAVVTDTAGQVYSTKVSRAVSVSPIHLDVIPEGGRLVAGVPNRIFVYASYPDGRPAAGARVVVQGLRQELTTGDLGIAELRMTPEGRQLDLTLKATDAEGLTGRRHVRLPCGTVAGDFLVQADRAVYDGGATMTLTCLGGGVEPIFVDLVKDDQTLMTRQIEMADGSGVLHWDLPAEVFGTVRIVAHRFDADGVGIRKSRTVFIRRAAELNLEVRLDREEYRPGESARMDVRLSDTQGEPVQGAVSLSIVDEAVYSVLKRSSPMEQVFFLLEQELLRPVFAVYDWDPTSLADVDADDRAEFEQALFSRSAEVDESRSTYTLTAFSFPAKEDAVRRDRAAGLRRVTVAWWCLAGACALFGAGALAVARPRAFLITAAVTGALVFCVAPLFVLYQAMDARMMFSTGSAVADGSEAAGEYVDMMYDGDSSEAALRVRQFFPETLLWRPELVTDEDGRLSLDFDLADSITTWRMSLTAVSADGHLGTARQPLRVFQPFFVDMDMPVALTRHDQFAIPVVVYNYLDEPQTVELGASKADWFSWLDDEGQDDQGRDQPTRSRTLELQPGEVRSVSFSIVAERVGRQSFQVVARAGEVSDAVRRTVDVEPNGHKVELTRSGVLAPEIEQELVVPPEVVEGSVRALVKLYPSDFSQLVEGLDAIFKMPYGCFEQTSSTTYPNVLALDYLRRSRTTSPAVEAKARQYIHVGYQRLVGFEVTGGGFDWFGSPPADLTLTAYGLMEFEDMARVHDVDPKLIDRTRRWLLARRDADGAWRDEGRMAAGRNRSRVGGSREMADLATTAYLATAVFADGRSPDRAPATLDYLLSAPPRSIDNPYLLAVVANAVATIEPGHASLPSYWDRLDQLKRTSDDGKQVWWEMSPDEMTTFYGGGLSGSVETTSLAALAMLRSGGPNRLIEGAMSWIAQQKDAEGTWHSTQATVLALKALTEALARSSGSRTPRRFEIAVDGNVVRRVDVDPDQHDVVQVIDVSDELTTGSHRLTVRETSDTSTGFQTVFRYHDEGVPREPAASEQAPPLSIEIRYDRNRLAVDERLTAECTIVNNTDRIAPMVLLDLPIPPGFELEAGELDELRGSDLIARYQLTPRKAIVYLRSLGAGERRTLRYRLRATTPVRVAVPDAEAYLYYDPSQRGQGGATTLEIGS